MSLRNLNSTWTQLYVKTYCMLSHQFKPNLVALMKFLWLGDPDQADNFDKLMEEMGTLQEEIDHIEGWEIDRKIGVAANALILPPDDVIVRQLSGESGAELLSVKRCWNSLIYFCWTNQLTISTLKLFNGWKAPCASIRGPSSL